jgi:signal transduction histidine kinase
MNTATPSLLSGQQLSQRMLWLIRLRWIAAGCLFLVLTAARFLFGLGIPVTELYLGNAVLLAANLAYLLLFRRLYSRINLFIGIQISLDLALLSYLLHFSGGVENPFFVFFVFHMFIAGILLAPRAAYLEAAIALSLFAILLAGEHSGLLPRPFVPGFSLIPAVGDALPYLVALLTAVAASLFGSVYLSSSIAGKLRQRDRELEAAVSSLKRKDLEKSRYVQQVSHDIRGSISAIQSCLRVVLDGLSGPLPDSARNMVGRAERRSRSLLEFANDLLYLSLLRAGEGVRKQQLSLSELLGELTREMRAEAEKRGLSLVAEDLCGGRSILADPEGIRRLLRHLLLNALQRSPAGGTVTAQAEVGAKGVRVRIAGTGLRIDAEELPHVFDDFYSGESGGGLGLAIVRQVAQVHGGMVAVESRPGEGCAFIVTLPA